MSHKTKKADEAATPALKPEPSPKDLRDPVTGVKKTTIPISKELKKETTAKKEVATNNSTSDEED